MSQRWLFALMLLIGAVCCVSCGDDDVVMTREEIWRELSMLPAIYITEDGTHVAYKPDSPDRLEAIVDPNTGKLAWIAMTCDNPNCPHAGDSKPYLFTLPHPGLEIDAGGRVVRAKPQSREEAQAISQAAQGRCPACVEAGVVSGGPLDTDFASSAGQTPQPVDWDPNNTEVETSWTRIYEPPEAQELRAELEEQLKMLNERMKTYHGEPGSGQ